MARNLMIQGTMSNAGKSVITAGILRILKQDGIKAAPFKSQNMALNSFVTKEGLELGRAQAMQAEAAGIEPLSCMNPILLKPTSDTGTQVIVNGRSVGNMSAEEYYGYKKKLIPIVMEAYRKLSERYDVIVIEGAGSPAEINLQENDIVNMGLARMVDAPVLLVGDIDRGGVFAQLLGTVELMEEEDRKRIRGFIINKFRGDPEILKPGLELFRKYCSIPFTGIVPYLQLDIDEEDSLSERLRSSRNKTGAFDVAIIRLPHISNYTDFAPLENRPDCSVRYVSRKQELGKPDIVIIPGTKNTLDDLRKIKQDGLAEAIIFLYKNGIPVFGICGGYQMMGTEIADPENTEGGGEEAGLALLPMKTVFRKEKLTSQMSAKVSRNLTGFYEPLAGISCRGYEIHMGSAEYGEDVKSFSIAEDGRMNGCCCGNAAGTYLHGFFDSAEISEALVKALRSKSRKSDLEQTYSRETVKTGAEQEDISVIHSKEYERLAGVLRKSLDMPFLYSLIK
jgi:adenosylcobyric acid synthase